MFMMVTNFAKGFILDVLAWSIPRIPRKFSFPSQTKYLPPIKTLSMALTIIYNFFFQMSKKSDLPLIPLIRSAKRIRGIGRNF